MSGWRLADGGAIDRSRPIRFRFDGQVLTGFGGDTVASALLANGVDVVARSGTLGRPRGIVAAGAEEPNALVAVEPGLGLRRATEVELTGGLAVRSVSGRAPVPQPDDTPGEHVYHHADVVIVGGGAAGIAAAVEAVSGSPARRVVLVEGGAPLAPLPVELADAEDFTFLPRTVAIGRFDSNMIVAHERRRGTPGTGPAARDRLWHIRAREVVLATGAIERPIVFADNDRPSIMLAGSVGTYLQRYGVAAGRRAVVFTTNDSAYVVARDLRVAGVEVVAIVDSREGGAAGAASDTGGIEVLSGHVVVGTDGDPALTTVHVARREAPSETRQIEADLLAVSGGWDPALRLYAHTGARLRYSEQAGTYVAAEQQPNVRLVGMAAAVNAGDPAFAAEPVWLVPAPDGSLDRHFVDVQRDATAADIRRAVDAGMRSVEHVKRFTTIGTGNDQGRTSGINEVGILATFLDTTLDEMGPTTFRTPLSPVPMRVLGGPYRGDLFEPVRTTPIHESHVAAGALFENVGQWKRAWAYPRPSESFDDAVLREGRAVREGVGIMDVSTLGKIDIQGPDAGVFLDRVYSNLFSTLKVGASRYGLMLRSDGMVFDDGTTTRLADDHYLMTTTTGGAAAVIDWLEEWLQTEWPDLRVRLTSVTDERAGVAIAGPRSRELLGRLAPHLDVGAEAFPFMTVRTDYVAELPARIFRISFSGELSYEVYVRSWYGRTLWDAIVAAGADLGVTPYGTEAMHVLRAEKGYVIVGQETDGTTTAGDVGLDWMLSKKKWFVGRQSLERPALTRGDRRQLVGLLPVDASVLVPEGSPLVLDGGYGTVGNVTSSYRSAALARTFALGLLAGGRARIGGRVDTLVGGERVPLQVVDPVFWDPKNERRDG